MPALYSHRLADIQRIGQAHGYAIAIHGSMQGDLDVIAVPWIEGCAGVDTFVTALCDGLGTQVHGEPEQRAHGRLCYTLLMAGACFMDLSVVPPVTY